jgi:hypothetical protein
MDRFHSVAVRTSLVSEDKYNDIKGFVVWKKPVMEAE